MQRHQLTYFLLSVILLLGCGEDIDGPNMSFHKIYDHTSAAIAFKPVDVVPLSEGYIVLAEKNIPTSNFAGVTIYQMDEAGDYIQEIDLSDEYVLPTGKMALVDSIAYFIAMHPITLESNLVAVTPAMTHTVTPLGSSYPLAADWSTSDELILLCYDPENLTSELIVYDRNGTELQRVSYSIGPGSDVQQQILNHYIDPDRYGLPFFCGQWSSGGYYFNGFYNYSLSLVFTGLTGGPTGVVQGQATNGGLSAIRPIEGSTFAIGGFQFGDVFVDAAATLSTNSVTSSIDLMESTISEFMARTPIRITEIMVGGESFSVIAAETEGRQVALYFYTNEGVLCRIQKIGRINPHTIATVRTDPDDNLLVLGTTFVDGRFERIYLQKVDNSVVREWL